MTTSDKTSHLRKSILFETLSILLLFVLFIAFDRYFLLIMEKGRMIIRMSVFVFNLATGAVFLGLLFTVVYYLIKKWSLHTEITASMNPEGSEFLSYRFDNYIWPNRIYATTLIVVWLFSFLYSYFSSQNNLLASVRSFYEVYFISFQSFGLFITRMIGAAALCIFTIGGYSFKNNEFRIRPVDYNFWKENAVRKKKESMSIKTMTATGTKSADFGKPSNFKELLKFSTSFLHKSNNGLLYVKKLQDWNLVKSMEDSSTGLGISIELHIGFVEIIIVEDMVTNLSLAASGEGVWTIVKDGKVLNTADRQM